MDDDDEGSEMSSDISGQTISSDEDGNKCCDREAIFNYLLPCLNKRRQNQIQPTVPDNDNKEHDLEM